MSIAILFFGNGQKKAEETPALQPAKEVPKPVEKPEPTPLEAAKTSLFGGVFDYANKTETAEAPKSFFAKEEKAEEKTEQPKSLFSGLFDNKKTEENCKPTSFFNLESKGGDLFGGKSAAGEGGSFFGKLGSKAEDGKPKKEGLFAGLMVALPSAQEGQPTNLFGNTPSNPLQGLFSKTSDANVDEDEEAVNGDEEEVPGQEEVCDPTKSTGTYVYESLTDVLANV